MSRVALCISGHFRSYEQAYSSLKKAILNPIRPDIFIFTWNTVGYDGADRGDNHLVKVPINQHRLQQLFAPKQMVIEPARVWDTRKYAHRLGSGLRTPYNVNGMFYGIYKANQLKKEFEKKHNFTYDIVIRGRADLLFNNLLNMNDIENCKNTNGIYFPKFGSYGGINDQFAFGSSKSMDLYAETYNNLDKYFDMGCLWHAETMMKFSVDYFELPILRTDIEYHILRANGRVFQLARE